MEKEEFRAVINHFYLKKRTAKQIKAELDEVHEDTAPLLKTVYFYINEFKRQARPKRSVEVTAPKTCSGSDRARND